KSRRFAFRLAPPDGRDPKETPTERSSGLGSSFVGGRVGGGPPAFAAASGFEPWRSPTSSKWGGFSLFRTRWTSVAHSPSRDVPIPARDRRVRTFGLPRFLGVGADAETSLVRSPVHKPESSTLVRS